MRKEISSEFCETYGNLEFLKMNIVQKSKNIHVPNVRPFMGNICFTAHVHANNNTFEFHNR